VDAHAQLTQQEEIPMYAVPKKLGYFQEEGLDVEYQGADGSVPALQALASGKAQIAVGDAQSIIQVANGGVPIKGWFVIVRNYPWAIGVLDTSPIKELKDLKGKTIGVISLGSAGYPYARTVVKSAGLNPDSDVQFVAVGVGAQAASALTSGKVDALALYGAAYATLENQGLKLRYLPQPDVVKSLFSITLASQESYIKEHSDVLVRFGRAVAKGLLFSHINPEAAIKISWDVFPTLKPASDLEGNLPKQVRVLRAWMDSAIYTSGDPATWKWGDSSPQAWDALQDYFLQTGALKEKGPSDRYWYGALIPEINKFDANKVIEQAKSYK
jgi:NitT/TauT family transport system substrate-binding protein